MKTNNLYKTILIVVFICISWNLKTKAQTPEAFLLGNWIGTIEFQKRNLTLVFRVNYFEKDSIHAFMDSPDQGAKDIKVSNLLVRGDSVFIRVKSLGVSVAGILSIKDSMITGIFRQSIFNGPIILKKVEKIPQINRPQEPKPPYPYQSNEISFKNETDQIELAATLSIPNTLGKYAAVVLISGSGPQNRDEELLGHKPFLVLADYLTRNGIAVLRYDDRGVGKSKGVFANASTYDFSRDAEAAVHYLKTLPNIDTTKIGLIGHSEGGMIAPIIASHNQSIHFIVLLAGPGLSGEEILLKQSALIAKTQGETEKNIAKANKINTKIYKIVKHEKDNSVAANKIRKAFDKYLETLTKEERIPLEAQKESMIQQILSPWFRIFLSFDPKKYLTKTHCAVLALNGANDLQVPPDENLAAIEKYLKAAGNNNYMIKKLPHLNHLFQTSATGSPNDYIKIEETFSPVALLIIKDWIKENTK